MGKLNILWTTDNKETIFNMLSMYAINSMKMNWWNEVNVILWGASVKLARSDSQIQTEILEMLNNGVSVEACRDCCETYGAVEILTSLGVTVRYMGEAMTEYIKYDQKLISI